MAMILGSLPRLVTPEPTLELDPPFEMSHNAFSLFLIWLNDAYTPVRFDRKYFAASVKPWASVAPGSLVRSLILPNIAYWAITCHCPNMCSQATIAISTLGLEPTAATGFAAAPGTTIAVWMFLFFMLPTIAAICEPGAYTQAAPIFQATRS